MAERLPNAEQARIDPRKLRDYALSAVHILGRHKAAFFAQMGYTADNWQMLEAALRDQHLSQPAEAGQASPFGQKYTITAPGKCWKPLSEISTCRNRLKPVKRRRLGRSTRSRRLCKVR